MTMEPEIFRGLVLATIGICMFIYLTPSARFIETAQSLPYRIHQSVILSIPFCTLDPQNDSRWLTRVSRTTYWVGGLMIVGFVLRYYQVGTASLWVDELYSVFVRGDKPIMHIIFARTNDSHPPLYYILLHMWMELGGNSELWVRLLSVILGTLAIPSIYLVGRTMFDARSGRVAALLLTISPFAIYQSQLARMYVLLLVLFLLSIWAFWQLRTTLTPTMIAIYIACTALLLWTHLYAIFVVISQNLLYLYESRMASSNGKRTATPLRTWFGIQAITAIIATPLLVRVFRLVLQVLGPSEGYVGWIPEPTSEMITRVLLLYGGLPHFHPFYAVNELTKGSSLVVISLFILSICLWIGSRFVSGDWYSIPASGEHQVAFLLLLFGMVVVLPFVLSAFLTPVFIPRYSIIGLVPFYLVLASGVVSLPEADVRRIVLVILVLSSAVTVNSYHHAETQEPWKPSLEYIESHYEPSDSVLINPGWTVSGQPIREYTDIPAKNTIYIPEGVTRNELHNKLSRTGNRIWILSYSPASAALIRDELSGTHSLTRQKEFGIITVYLYTTGANPSKNVEKAFWETTFHEEASGSYRHTNEQRSHPVQYLATERKIPKERIT